ncbi:MAG TPA: DUF3078 domain-containing protein [Flavisolibacter sp.]|jgi:hypothetical protein|nr:DUF3078 domain-containing protein [Flavisolibacter sp.]
MRRLFFVFIASLFALTTFSQTATSSKFKTGGMITLMGGQSGTRNWAPAGEEKFSLTAYGNLQLWANKEWGKNKWMNNLEVAYALINTTSGGVRKIDDKFDLYSKYSHALEGSRWALGAVGSLRTQLVNGYDYSETERKRVSGFFAPAYISLSPGLQFSSANNALNLHIGPGARWVVVSNSPYSLNYQGAVKPDGSTERTLASFYGVDPQREVRFEPGIYFSGLFYKEVAKNVTWKTRLDVTNDVTASQPLMFDVYWTNTIGMKVNNWLSVNYNFDLYSDDDVRMFGRGKQSPATQMKSILGVGVAAKF